MNIPTSKALFIKGAALFPPLRLRLSWCKSSAGSATGRERERERGLPPPPSSPFSLPHSSLSWSTRGHIYDRFPDFHEKFMRGLPFSLLPPFYPFRSSFLLPYLIWCPLSSTVSCKKIHARLNLPALFLPIVLGSQCTAHQP